MSADDMMPSAAQVQAAAGVVIGVAGATSASGTCSAPPSADCWRRRRADAVWTRSSSANVDAYQNKTGLTISAAGQELPTG